MDNETRREVDHELNRIGDQPYEALRQSRVEYEAAVAEAHKLFYTKLLITGGLLALGMKVVGDLIIASLPLFLFSIDYMQSEMLRRAHRHMSDAKKKDDPPPVFLKYWPASKESLDDLQRPHSWHQTLIQLFALAAAPLGMAVLLHGNTPMTRPAPEWIALAYGVVVAAFTLTNAVPYRRWVAFVPLAVWYVVLAVHCAGSKSFPFIKLLVGDSA